MRLAQDFASRFPLIEGQGNFGNIDGDNAAAMRYTESRLTEIAELLLRGIDENAVDFRATYDGEEQEPMVLPGAFPNLLANGASGIAVGMATSIPPHNAGEVCAAAMHLIAHPEADTAALLQHLRGPDFPTGGELVEDEATICAAYETGRGSLRTRARWVKEAQKNGTWVIVVTEIPYQVQKSRLVEQIALLLTEKKLPLLGDIRDESAENIRLVLEPKSRTVDADMLMASLFRATALESRFAMNMNVLTDGRMPRVMGLRDLLRAWLDHRHEVLVRRSNHRLDAIARRLEILEGYLAVFLNLDEVIRIIRTEDEPKPVLMKTLHADRYPGRGDPQHAPALAAPPRRDGDPQRAQEADRGAEIADRAAQGRGQALGEDLQRDRRGARRNSAPARSAPGVRRSAPPHRSWRSSPRRWSSARRSP